eukprot:gene9590-19933_t
MWKFPYWRYIPVARSEGNDACEQYNSILQRFQWAERRSRCNNENDCVFLGRSFTGMCTARDVASIAPKKEQQSEMLSYNTGSDFPVNSESEDKIDSVAIDVLVKERITTSAVESLRDSQQLANDMAKTLVIDIFQDKANVKKLGHILQYLFSFEKVLEPTRHLVHWSLQLPVTVDNTTWLVKAQRQYYFTGGGSTYTNHHLLVLIQDWLLHPQSRSEVIRPLVLSVIRDTDTNTDLFRSITQLTSTNIKDKHNEVAIQGALNWAITEFLNAEQTKAVARDSMVHFLKHGVCSEEIKSDQDQVKVKVKEN